MNAENLTAELNDIERRIEDTKTKLKALKAMRLNLERAIEQAKLIEK